MSTPKEAKILAALRDRLTDDGLTVHLGRLVDPADDDLPLVSVHYAQDGVETERESFPRRKVMTLDVDHYFVVDEEDYLIQAIEKTGDVVGAITDRPDRDAPDTIGGLADSVRPTKSIVVSQPEESRTGVTRTTIEIAFFDEE